MKKNMIKMLLITGIGFFLACLFCCLSTYIINPSFGITEFFFNESEEFGLLMLPFSFLGDFVNIFAIGVFYIMVPIGVAILGFLMQLIGTIFQIGEEKSWKDNCSKIFSYISVVVQGLLGGYLILLFILTFNFILILAIVFVFVAFVLNIKEVKKIKF